jgi:hypothetical protein
VWALAWLLAARKKAGSPRGREREIFSRFRPFGTRPLYGFVKRGPLRKREKISWGLRGARSVLPARSLARGKSSQPKGGTMHLTDCFAPFDRYLAACGCAKNTRESYQRTLRKFEKFLELSDRSSEAEQLKKEDVSSFLAGCEEAGETRSSVILRLVILKKFFGWLRAERQIAEDPAAGIPIPKERKRIPRYLSPAQVESLHSGPKEVDSDLGDIRIMRAAGALSYRVGGPAAPPPCTHACERTRKISRKAGIQREQILKVAANVVKVCAESGEPLAVQRRGLELALKWLKLR